MGGGGTGKKIEILQSKNFYFFKPPPPLLKWVGLRRGGERAALPFMGKSLGEKGIMG